MLVCQLICLKNYDRFDSEIQLISKNRRYPSSQLIASLLRPREAGVIDIADGMSDIGAHVSSPKISSLPKGYTLRDEVSLFWYFGENMDFFLNVSGLLMG